MNRRKDDKNRVLKEGESQRPNGTYEYKYRDSGGTRHSVYAKTLEELREKEKSIVRDVLDGVGAASNMTVGIIYAKWIKTKRKVRSTTLDAYNNVYKRHIEAKYGGTKVKDVKKQNVIEYFQTLVYEKGLSKGTVKTIYAVLSQIFDYAIDEFLIRVNPVSRTIGAIDAQKKVKQETLTRDEQEEFEWFLPRFRKGRYETFFKTLLWTGARVGEIECLQWEDVDFENNRIYIDKTLVCRSKKDHAEQFGINIPKTEAGKRTIPMLPVVRETLLKQKRIQEQNATVERVSICGYSNFVFTTINGRPFTSSTLNILLNIMVNKHNEEYGGTRTVLPHIHNHMFRHTFATRMYESGVSLKAMQTVLGHSTISVTMDIYTDASEEFVEEQLKTRFSNHMVNTQAYDQTYDRLPTTYESL